MADPLKEPVGIDVFTMGVEFDEEEEEEEEEEVLLVDELVAPDVSVNGRGEVGEGGV
jgi:hypothetical protein